MPFWCSINCTMLHSHPSKGTVLRRTRGSANSQASKHERRRHKRRKPTGAVAIQLLFFSDAARFLGEKPALDSWDSACFAIF